MPMSRETLLAFDLQTLRLDPASPEAGAILAAEGYAELAARMARADADYWIAANKLAGLLAKEPIQTTEQWLFAADPPQGMHHPENG